MADKSFDSFVKEEDKVAEQEAQKNESKTETKTQPRVHLIRTTRNNLQKYGDVLFSLGDALLTWADDVQRESKDNSLLRRKEFELEYNQKSKALDEQAMTATGCDNEKDAWSKIQERKQRDRDLFAD